MVTKGLVLPQRCAPVLRSHPQVSDHCDEAVRILIECLCWRCKKLRHYNLHSRLPSLVSWWFIILLLQRGGLLLSHPIPSSNPFHQVKNHWLTWRFWEKHGGYCLTIQRIKYGVVCFWASNFPVMTHIGAHGRSGFSMFSNSIYYIMHDPWDLPSNIP